MRRKILIILTMMIILLNIGLAQFGKNKVNYEAFNWEFIQTEHFDIYFYSGGKDLAVFAAPIAEEQVGRISKLLNWEINKRIPLIIYNSHSDFQQTNVILNYLGEGTGGFTELFKNRAVVAFDGDYHEFWHVIRHELLHVVVNDMIYGGSIQSVVSGSVRYTIPLWMHEGLAEFISDGWDTEADMIIRDIALSNNIPDIEYLDSYLAYKGGQSVYRFISEKYGAEKIGEIWRKMKGRKNVSRGFKSSVGMDLEELSIEWHKWVRKLYWPDISEREELEDFAIQLTDVEELKNHFNTAPAISPNGTSVALISDRKGYADIYLISAIDGKVIKKVLKGQRSPSMEEMKWLNPQLNWSPDGKKIVLATKSGATDAVIVCEVKSGDIEKHTFDNLEEIFSPDWSPDGESIVFIGLQHERSDLYVYHIRDEKLTQLTDDMFSDFEPSWSPDGGKIVFSAQRGSLANEKEFVTGSDISNYNYHQTDLFCYDLSKKTIERLTDTPWSEKSPIWANTRDAIIFSSDKSGVCNLYVLDFTANESEAITNALTGVFQPSISSDDSRLVFAGYANSGWDVYTLSNPFDDAAKITEIKTTDYGKELQQKWTDPAEYDKLFTSKSEPDKISGTQKTDKETGFSTFIFAPEYSDWERVDNELQPEDTAQIAADISKYKDENDEFVTNKYKTKFSLDLIDSQAGYNTYWGFQGNTIFAFSDILGNHRITLGTEMYIDLENSDYNLSYQYLTKRINYAFTGFHSANFYYYNYMYMLRWRNYGFAAFSALPLSKFTRFEFGGIWYNVEQNMIDIQSSKSVNSVVIHTILPQLGFVFDNTLWSYFYPIDGWRGRLDFVASPKYDKHSYEFNTLKMDLRRYFKINRKYTFGLRLATGLSGGENAQHFFVGGESNWLNPTYKRNKWGSDDEYIQNIYFSEFVFPLRGARYYEKEGTRFFLTNFEFRYPFIEYLKLGWPLPVTMGNIQGITFLDLGSAWSEDFHPFGKNEHNKLFMDDLVGGFGFGTRLFLGYFLLKIDVAWRFDFTYVSKPKYYFSLGMDF